MQVRSHDKLGAQTMEVAMLHGMSVNLALQIPGEFHFGRGAGAVLLLAQEKGLISPCYNLRSRNHYTIFICILECFLSGGLLCPVKAM